MTPHALALLPFAVALAACSTLSEGNDQTIMLLSYPTGAACEVSRGGALIAGVERTPMTVQIPSSAEPIDVECTASGFRSATKRVGSVAPPGSYGRYLLGGQAGRKVDSALLTEFRYPGTVMVMIDPEAALPPPLPLAH